MGSNNADNCNFMDMLFRTQTFYLFSIFNLFLRPSGERHWRTAL